MDLLVGLTLASAVATLDRPESESRFSRCKSARMSAAFW
jgi:hypothetical protein